MVGYAGLNPQVVVLSHREDGHALAVLSALSASVRPFLLDMGRMGLDFVATATGDGTLCLLTRGGDRVTFEETAFWWNRRPRVTGFEDGEKRFRDTRASELMEFWGGVLRHQGKGVWCNPQQGQREASNKIHQYHLAKSVGMKCPDTIWTNNRDDVEAFIEKHGGSVVFKMFVCTEALWQPCRKFDETFVAHIEHVRFMPAIYQEYLAGTGEYRVTIFGEHCFAARADMAKSRFPSDVRMDLALARTAETLPSGMEAKLRTFMGKLGLLYAAFDLREDAEGNLVFLECNPTGQFLYLDHLYDGGMSKAFCGFIEDHVKTGPNVRAAQTEDGAVTSFDFTADIRVPIYEIANSWATEIPAN